MKQKGLFWHVHHDELAEFCFDRTERVDSIVGMKPRREIARRIRLLRPVHGNLPSGVAEAVKDCEKAALADSFRTKAACDVRLRRSISENSFAMIKLHRAECRRCPWNGHTIFPNFFYRVWCLIVR